MRIDDPLIWPLAFALIFTLGFGALFWFRFRDRKYLQKPTREALSPSLKKEIEKEKEVFEQHQKKFNAALDKARNKHKP